MQSLGQMVGMLFLNPVSDTLGRKVTLYVLWIILLGVRQDRSASYLGVFLIKHTVRSA